MGSQSKLKKISLSDLIDKQINYLKKRLPVLNSDISLKINTSNDIFITGNNVLLGWAIENIIRNAIDSIKTSNGIIEISVFQKGDHAMINILDNGSGVLKKDWKNIFKPGFSSKKGGWGLGLSLVKRIVEEIHSGSVFVLASSPDKGTTFQIKLKSER